MVVVATTHGIPTKSGKPGKGPPGCGMGGTTVLAEIRWRGGEEDGVTMIVCCGVVSLLEPRRTVALEAFEPCDWCPSSRSDFESSSVSFLDSLGSLVAFGVRITSLIALAFLCRVA